MRPYIILIFTALVLAFYSGRYLLKFQGPGSASNSDLYEIAKVKLSFQKNVTPYAIVNFSSLYYSKDQMQLLNPSIAINHFDDEILTSTSDCGEKKFVQSPLRNYSKKLIWDQLRCGKRLNVPFWFVKKPPFMHPSGSSYAYLLYRRQLARERTPSLKWIRENLGYFHIKELNEIQREQGALGGIYGILATLDEKSLVDLINREGTILTKDFLLAKISYPKSFDIMEYRFYLRDDLNHFLENTPFHISRYFRGKRCLYQDGPICWRYNVRHLFQMINFGTIVSFGGVVFIFALILWLLFSKIKQDKIEDKRRKMALQVLTHEFRTPVASLLLTMDNINRNIANFDDKTQEDLLRMSAEIYRLQRLTEKSKHYLQGAANKGLVNFHFERVPSIEDLIYDIVIPIGERHEDDVQIDFKDEIGEFSVDGYWFQIILKNLVENAYIHGKPPVAVTVWKEKNAIFIKVQDTGKVAMSFEQLTEEFSKGNKSSGTGLGLSIVNKVIKEWGGSLTLDKDPTAFTLKLPNKD
jgi:signal transduction histidine kinase